jgi:Flp pilus assembly pilin Flp
MIRNERGATGVEYGIMIAAIAAIISLAALALGGKAVEGFNFVNGSF